MNVRKYANSSSSYKKFLEKSKWKNVNSLTGTGVDIMSAFCRLTIENAVVGGKIQF